MNNGDNGKENGNYSSILGLKIRVMGDLVGRLIMGIMEKKMETTILL